MSKVNVKETAEHIELMARRLHEAAVEMDAVAKLMANLDDITYASQAGNIVSNLMPNLRIDMLVSKPLRAFEMAIRE